MSEATTTITIRAFEATTDFAGTLMRLPRHPSGAINWKSMSTDEISWAFVSAVAVGDKAMTRRASDAGARAWLRTLKAERANR
tara:strand:- start:1079 stop:1327 length:249 start_codon:yes stop_codon:yes gene_type:complete